MGERRLPDGYYTPRPFGLASVSNSVFWRWFDGLPPVARGMLNVLPRTAYEFQALMARIAQQYPLTDRHTRV